MSTFKVPVTVLDEVLVHPNADAIEMARLKGWKAIVKKEVGHRPGDRVVYIPEGAVVPQEVLRVIGLEGRLSGKHNNRVKAIMLRGELSQGIVLSMDEFSHALIALGKDASSLQEKFAVGEDVAHALGIIKYEEPIPVHLSGQAISRPPWFSRYTEVENIKNFPDVFVPGEEVIATEKLHGCLHYNTRVVLADGSKKRIGTLVKENFRGEVLGLDKSGKIVATPVLNTFNNGNTDEWVLVRFGRKGANRGSSYGTLRMTPNHRIYSPMHRNADSEGYVRADDLCIGDSVLMQRSVQEVTPLAEQMMIGKMLGDGSLNVNMSGLSADISFGHEHSKSEYVSWTLRGLGDFAGNPQESQTIGYGSLIRRGRSIRCPEVFSLFSGWIDEGKKKVPDSVVHKIGPIALAFWYMDDGSLAHTDGQEDRVDFATNGFDEGSIDVLLESLAKFGIQGVKYESAGWRIRLNTMDSEKFFLLIAPYVCDVMRYKLPERYRCGPSWLPSESQRFRPLSWQSVMEVKRETPVKDRYKFDLQTGTSNFFAGDVLVHNSNFGVGMHREELGHLYVSSRKLCLVENDKNTYWRAAKNLNLRDVLVQMLDLTGADYGVIWHEIYGHKIQDLGYGGKPGEINAASFDIQLNGEYQDVDTQESLRSKLGIVGVPVLYRGPFSYAALMDVTVGKDTISNTHMREGVVIRPVRERYDVEKNLGRVLLKSINPAYSARKGGTEYQ